MKFGIEDTIFEKIIELIRNEKSIKKAILFGSRARGDYKNNSDIDIAIVVDGETTAGFKLDLDEAAGLYKVDIIELDKLEDEVFKNKILKEGIVIFERGV
ncbi:DNA polymerase beta domain protein region [Caldicellulosiruptor acetigenus I77R1B]|uniref:DNA polymerase beta domain protein region n=1 Tax=Caldicellulosiruptor acetigenus (strain ATCC 700853 / DSM 12137 / I77R1B) TaxID=632335 RepID=E4S6L2_CALA7|nr:nucleotidyltransferase domain-containing protein [Caldicellulosiruptor acetigenus]ADQ40627.1 DNA polymerase beta domain protein region [Caldicellulosiruptor acetigenus I77R1B]